MIVEYIIIIAMAAVVAAFLFPVLRNGISEKLEPSTEPTTAPDPTPVAPVTTPPVAPAPTVDSFNNDFNDSVMNSFTLGPVGVALLFAIGLAVLTLVIMLIVKVYNAEKERNISKTDEKLEKEETKEEEEEKSVKDLIYDIEHLVKRNSLISILGKENVNQTHKICEYLKLLTPKMDEFDKETKHTISRIIKTELPTLLSDFSALNKKNQQTQKEVVSLSLDAIEEKLDKVFARLEEKKLMSFLKTAAVISKRYESTN